MRFPNSHPCPNSGTGFVLCEYFHGIEAMTIPVQFEIGFKDAEFLRHSREATELTVLLRAWNNVRLRIVFTDILGVQDGGS
jgi:hypothetical protein